MKAIMRDKAELKDSGIEWIGLLPANWSYCKIKNMTTEPETIFTDGDWINGPDVAEEGIRYLTTGNIGQGNFKEQGNGFVTEKTFEELNCTAVYPGDLVISRLNSPVGRACIIPNTYPKYVVAVDNVILRPDLKYLRKFLMYCMSSDRYSEFTQLLARGTTMQRISRTQLGNIFLPVTTVDEQQVIVTYLDDRCAKIDAIIAEAKASIEEYKELKQAVIYEAVTKGLDKNIEMKGYGDWFDKCPSNWRYEQIRYLYELRDERNFEPLSEVNLISLYTDQGVMQHSDIEKTSGNKAVTADGYKKVYPEDIVVNIILCWMGAMGRSEYQGVTSPAYDVYKPLGCSKVCSKYYHYLFRTDRFSKKCYTVGRGIMMMRWRTYSSQFRAIKVPVPPYEEQVEIANYLDKRISQIEELVNAKQSLIEDLESYKKSLIYEVVTGKRKVVE